MRCFLFYIRIKSPDQDHCRPKLDYPPPLISADNPLLTNSSALELDFGFLPLVEWMLVVLLLVLCQWWTVVFGKVLMLVKCQ